MPTITRKDLFAQIRDNPAKRQQVRSALGSQWNKKPTEAIAKAVGLQATSRKSIAGAKQAKATAKRHGFAKTFAAENASKHLNGDKEQAKAQILKAINRDLKKAEKVKGDKLSREEKRAIAAKALKTEVLKIRSGEFPSNKKNRPLELSTKKTKKKTSETAIVAPQEAQDMNPYARKFRKQLEGGGKLSPDEEKAIIEYAKTRSVGDYFERYWKPKAQKIAESGEGISFSEGGGLASYLSAQFPLMNGIIRGKIETKDGKLISNLPHINGLPEKDADALVAMNVAATSAMKKLPPVTEESIKQHFPYASHDGSLKRYMRIEDPEVLDTFRKERGVGSIVFDPAFSSCTAFSNPHQTKQIELFSSDANIHIAIDYKKDGSSQGKIVDHFKTSAVEGEVLFPPSVNFRVKENRVEERPMFPLNKPFVDLDSHQIKAVAKHLKTLDPKECQSILSFPDWSPKNTSRLRGEDIRHAKVRDYDSVLKILNQVQADFSGYKKQQRVLIRLEEI